MGADDREKALELAFTQIEKQFGKGAIMKLGKAEILKGIGEIPNEIDEILKGSHRNR